MFLIQICSKSFSVTRYIAKPQEHEAEVLLIAQHSVNPIEI